MSGLGEPYGTCSSVPLEYYTAASGYTAVKCQMECSTKALEAECQCKEDYMPGEYGGASRLSGLIRWIVNQGGVGSVLGRDGWRCYTLLARVLVKSLAPRL